MQSIVESVSDAFSGQSAIAYDSSLSVLDNRTGKTYSIPIARNAVRATDFKQIKGDGSRADVVEQMEAGLRILDPGYMNTAVVESSVTFIDGIRGTIHYREHSLDKVVRDNDWEEVVYLINWGHLPTLTEKVRFRKDLAANMVPPQPVVDVIRALPRDALICSMMQAGLAAYTSCDKGSRTVHSSGRPHYVKNMPAVDAAIVRTLSAFAVVIALAYCHKRGKEFTAADPNGSFIGNCLLMMGFTQNGKPDATIERCFEKLWILYANHEMTNSTAAFLHTASSLTDPISGLAAALLSGYGPLHGAAIECAFTDFERIGVPANVPAFLDEVKGGKQRLFGYGHRVYKAVDPRAKWIRAMLDQHKDRVYGNELLQVAMEIDRLALNDPYFKSRNLKVNADLYGTFLYTAMGFETDIIVAMCSLSRAGGLMAHWREAMGQKPCIWRPQQVFTGSIPQGARAKL
ncbi:citrate synthase [Aaosphaeria arxii CBS 175.79]|uniref:Citrate synthase n=1 Tax=Aaosphaeria arxii CBS 175.79 TaxID=1450172 RepID=A0A6A5Y8N8_9PLEO|nr:citrate synthase [Aaosphaeria arxii CBS 175.79]KAF2021111.1 citrate synthase [Aaosphaeria arxii CBS 175.79]